jgi:hypothetical protein
MIPLKEHPKFFVGRGGVLEQFRMDENLFGISFQEYQSEPTHETFEHGLHLIAIQ